MFAILRQKVVEKWGSKSDTYYTAPSGFIFLRFWAPAILGPKLFGLVTDHPKKIPARTLTLISKT
jgi:Ras GTPase-activating protein 3